MIPVFFSACFMRYLDCLREMEVMFADYVAIRNMLSYSLRIFSESIVAIYLR